MAVLAGEQLLAALAFLHLASRPVTSDDHSGSLLTRIPRPSVQDKVLSAARRLLESAPAIRAAGVNLEGASLAIDDCYELWDSGGW